MNGETSSGWSPELRSRIFFLHSELSARDVPLLETPMPDLPVECYLGVDQSGATWMRVACDPGSVSTDDRSVAVQFDVTGSGYRVVVQSGTDELVTAHFLEELTQLIRDGHAPGDAGRAALQNWRDLLAAPPGSPLTEKALVGLLGELEVLASIVRTGGVVDDWTGWQQDQCDFRIPGLAIEVKSTTSASYRRVQVHGLRQLADPEDGSGLILVLRRFERSPEGISVPTAIEDLVSMGISRSILLNRLSNVGYSEAHRADYERFRFVSKEVALRQVDESHPRLTPEMLEAVDLSCIDSVDYELNLNGTSDADLDTDLETILAAHL